MQVMTLNSGGSSIKFVLIDTGTGSVLLEGGVERIGSAAGGHLRRGNGAPAVSGPAAAPDHRAATAWLLDQVRAHADLSGVEAVGHRVVHAGPEYTGAVRITPEVIAALERYSPFAPLHNPPNLLGIRACLELLPGVPQVAVFDNTMHWDLPAPARTYALPRELAERHLIRRYGFHGLAIMSALEQLPDLDGRPLDQLRVVTLMLGSGTTANAFRYGRSVDVSTGLTPLEGLVQSTRSGDLDPAVILYLMRTAGYSVDQVEDLLYKRSGWLGISGRSADMVDLLRAEAEGDADAALALDVFAYRCRKYVGAYAAAMGGIDALLFTGGIGERSPAIRERICRDLEFLGIAVDPARNAACPPGGGRISPDAVPVGIYVAPARENHMIAMETERALRLGR